MYGEQAFTRELASSEGGGMSVTIAKGLHNAADSLVDTYSALDDCLLFLGQFSALQLLEEVFRPIQVPQVLDLCNMCQSYDR